MEGREGESPLHKAVRWVNGLGEGGWGGRDGKGGEGEGGGGGGVVELLLDAGADPRFVVFCPFFFFASLPIFPWARNGVSWATLGL